MSAIQTKLIKITRVKPDKCANRQDYLYNTALYISDKLTNDQYDQLADKMEEAIVWFEAAVKAIESKISIPDFPDYDPEETESVESPEPPEPTEAEITRWKFEERYGAVTGEKDKWGIHKGTKTSAAMEMFEQGATMKVVKKELGGVYYNALYALAKKGHKLDYKNGVWTLTHVSL